MGGQYTLDSLLSEEDAALHRRPRIGRLFADPAELATWFMDPHLALAASVLIINLQDLRSPKPARRCEAQRFFSSQWCWMILGGLGLEANRFFCLLKGSDYLSDGNQILETEYSS